MASVLIIKPCPFCKKEYQKMFPADGYRRYQAQRAFNLIFNKEGNNA